MATPAGDDEQLIFNIISVPWLFKNILSLSKVAINSMDATTVNHLVQEVTKVSGSLPFVGVGMASLGLIVNNIAMAEDNKGKREEIRQHCEFLREHLPELGEEETWQEELQGAILLLCQQACILEYEKKRREGCMFRVWSCLGDVVTARFKATTLERVAVQLKSIRADFDTLLKFRTIHLIPKYSPLLAGDVQEFVGIETRKKEVMSFLEQPQEIHVVGIYGLGGIGKTTLLRIVRQEIQEKKKHVMAYVELGQEVSITALQQEIVQQLCGQNFKFRDDSEGRARLLACIKQIRDKKIIDKQVRDRHQSSLCLILDNVWKDQHLEKLLPHDLKKHLPPSSIFLMSSRPKQQAEMFCQLICGADMSCCKLYQPPLLSPEEAERLFLSKAMAGGQEFQGTESALVKRIVPLCGGLPLALKIYGSYFNSRKRRTEDAWKTVERRLKDAEDSPHSGEDKVFERLQVSLDLQPPALRQDFVDAALFWKGKPWDDARAALIDENLLHLEDQSLVAQDELDETVKVHDLMVALAMKYVKNLKASKYVVDTSLDDSTEMEQLRGVSCIDTKVDMVDLVKMSNLRFLILDSCRIHVSLIQRRYLLDKYLPHITQRGWLLLFLTYLLVSTIILNISRVSYTPIFIIILGFIFLFFYLFSSHVAAPTFLCKDLTFLTLKDCVNTINLARSIGNLSNLRSLNLSHNHGFTHFPSLIFSNLTSLHVLNLSACEELTRVPSLGHMKSLRSLDLSSCTQLQELPKSLGDLGRLKKLDVSNCHRLASLPETLGELKELEILKATNCDELDRLPRSIDKLTSLQHLDLSCSDQLTRLPPTICSLASLQVLDMSRCSALKELPENLGNLQSLKVLVLSHCERLVQLPASIGNLASLKILDLSFCDELKELPTNMQYLTSLEVLDITSCRKLHTLPNLSSFLPHSLTEVRGQPKSSAF